MLSKLGVQSARGLTRLHVNPKVANVTAVRFYNDRDRLKSESRTEFDAADRGRNEAREAADNYTNKARARAEERADELNKVEKASIADTHGNEALEEAKAAANKSFEDAARGIPSRPEASSSMHGSPNMSRDAMDYMHAAKQSAANTAKLSLNNEQARNPGESMSDRAQEYMKDKVAGRSESRSQDTFGSGSSGQSKNYMNDNASGAANPAKSFNSAADNAYGRSAAGNAFESANSKLSQSYGSGMDKSAGMAAPLKSDSSFSAGQGSQVNGPQDLNQTKASVGKQSYDADRNQSKSYGAYNRDSTQASVGKQSYDVDRNQSKSYSAYNRESSSSTSTFDKMKEKAASAYETVKEKVNDAYEAVMPNSDNKDYRNRF
jgi:hypothetical protein